MTTLRILSQHVPQFLFVLKIYFLRIAAQVFYLLLSVHHRAILLVCRHDLLLRCFKRLERCWEDKRLIMEACRELSRMIAKTLNFSLCGGYCRRPVRVRRQIFVFSIPVFTVVLSFDCALPWWYCFPSVERACAGNWSRWFYFDFWGVSALGDVMAFLIYSGGTRLVRVVLLDRDSLRFLFTMFVNLCVLSIPQDKKKNAKTQSKHFSVICMLLQAQRSSIAEHGIKDFAKSPKSLNHCRLTLYLRLYYFINFLL